MRASWLVARTELRRRWRSVLLLTILVGLIGAVVLGALAGARRTSSAFDRFQDATYAGDLTVFIPEIDDSTMAELRRLPGVISIGRGRQIIATVNGASVSAGAPLDDVIGRTIARPRVLEGRLPRADDAHEVAVPEPLAQAGHVGIGDRLTLRGYTQDQIDAIIEGGDFGAPEGPRVPLRVVGITRSPGDLSIEGAGGGLLFLTREFVREYGDQIGNFAPVVLLVRVTDDDAASAFVEKARKLTEPFGQPGEFQVQPPSETAGAVQQSIDVLGSALVAFGAVVALAGTAVVSIALRRFVDTGAPVMASWRALGMTQRERFLALATPLVPIGIGGAILGAAGAWLASPLLPLGLAREAEPSPGLDLDPVIIGAGFLAVLAIVGAIGCVVSLRAQREAVASATPRRLEASRAARAALAAGWAPPVTVGLAMALEPGRGRTAVPVRPAIAAAVVGVLGVIAVGVFGSSLSHLVSTPAAFGYAWDTHFTMSRPDVSDPARPCSSARTPLADDRAVAAVSAVCSVTVEVDGHAVGAYGFVALSGAIEPVVLAGRLPNGPEEVALGTETLSQVHKSLGDRVEVAGPGSTHSYRVVGRVVLPKLGAETDVQAVADGAVLTGQGVEALVDNGDVSSIDFVVRWRPGADVAAAGARVADRTDGLSVPRRAEVPLEVKRLDQLDALPWILGGLLALIGVLGVGYALVTAVHRRARDLAVMKTIGFRRRQVIATVATQATVFAIVGLVIGIPLGIALGSLVWRAVANGAGLPSDATLSLLVVTGVSVATLAIVNVVAILPARAAARTRPATVLRSE